MSDAQLAEFVAATAAMLNLPLDEQGSQAVRDVLRGMGTEIALVLDDASAEGFA